jgi:hypothetical protein
VSATDYKSFLAMLKGEHSTEPAPPSGHFRSLAPPPLIVLEWLAGFDKICRLQFFYWVENYPDLEMTLIVFAQPGPKTPEGKARVVWAMVAGRRLWVERMKADGRKFPCGRKPGSRIKLQATSVRSPKDYRRMTLEELRDAALESNAILRDRLRRTGRLSG